MAEIVHCKKPSTWAFDDAEMGKPVEQRKDTRAFAELIAKSDKVDIKKTLKGVLVSFPFADGYAHYKVIQDAPGKPLVLEHVPYGDAWRLAPYSEKGLARDDIMDAVRYRRNLNAAMRK